MKSPLQSSSLFTAAAAAAYGFEGRRFFPQQLTPPEESFDDENQLPTPEEFDKIVQDYLNNLSPKKRDKALVDQKRYQVIQQVLKDPRNTAISTAQFRFWVKKMFQLQPGTVGLVCHDGKPVAMKEQIYTILVQAHREAQHGGRDKTSALVSCNSGITSIVVLMYPHLGEKKVFLDSKGTRGKICTTLSLLYHTQKWRSKPRGFYTTTA